MKLSYCARLGSVDRIAVSEEMESALHKLSLLVLSGIQKDKHVFLQDDLNSVGLDEDQVQ